jgi:4-hydroxythreonine-4-phosphate dehydrogenase
MRIAITIGDPRGIGPEIIRKAVSDPRTIALGVEWVVVGPSGTEQAADVVIGAWDAFVGRSTQASARAGQLAGLAVERATQMALRGEVQGIVTAPLDKAALHAGGYDYPGHTEMLGALAGCRTTMMLASDRLRVVLATTHIALAQVHAALTHDVLVQTARATRRGLREGFGIDQPRIALCALNPHGGDGGRFGHEDDTVLAPAAREAEIAGPFPADTVFVRAMRGEFDAVIAPYHDVGMTAMKVASFGSAVNVTLGLPFVRTSPDHGTALDIAGTDVASAESMIAAMVMAVTLAARAQAGRDS